MHVLQQFGVIKCYFFEKNNQAIFMDSECCAMLETFLATELQGIEQMVGKICLQEDGATIHQSYPQSLASDCG
jgi:hypothetical protein